MDQYHTECECDVFSWTDGARSTAEQNQDGVTCTGGPDERAYRVINPDSLSIDLSSFFIPLIVNPFYQVAYVSILIRYEVLGGREGHV